MSAPAHRTLDRAGMVASLLCAVHCAAMPVVVAAMPMSGVVGFVASPQYEVAFLLLAVVLGVVSLVWGFRIHKRYGPAVLLSVGIALVLGGHWLLGHDHPLELPSLVIGALAMSAAHGLNFRHCMVCSSHHHDHGHGHQDEHSHHDGHEHGHAH